jgi:F420H(2)-dependent quinone reductase
VSLTGDYAPSSQKWVRDQVERYEATEGREANTLAGTRRPVVIFTTRGRKTGKITKFPLMRVEHDGKYAMVASKGGAARNPKWYLNLKADPEALMVQDGAERFDATARELHGEERKSGGSGPSRSIRRTRGIRRGPSARSLFCWPNAARIGRSAEWAA